MNRQDRRILFNKIVMALSWAAAMAGLVFLFWIIGILFYKGFTALSPDIFRYDMAPPGREPSGLRNALVGQLMLVVGASVIGIPIGMLAGTWLSEYGGRHGGLARIIRDISDIMMSTPSIVIGAFVYAILVAPMGHFSGWAGIAALAVMMVPIVLRTTDDMLQLVPGSLREAAIALGAPKYKMIIQVVYRGARTGILTGILLAVARIAGETAPLLFTSFSNNFFSTDLDQPIASLTVTMFNYATSPYKDWIEQGWAAALLLTLFVLGANILGRAIIRQKQGSK